MKRMGGSLSGPPPDPYDRRRSSRRLVLSLIVVLAVGIAAGTALGRQTAPGQRPSPSPSSHPVTAGVPGVGASRVEAGIAVGYQHTPEGAALAVGNYLAALGGRLALNPPAAKAALDQVADPGARSVLENGQTASQQLDETLWGVETAAQQGKRVLLTQTPIAYKVTTYTSEEATVAVWLVTTVGVENKQRLLAFFANGAATVVWLNGDWRLRAISGGDRAADIIPACLQTPTQTGGVPPQLDGFVPYGSR